MSTRHTVIDSPLDELTLVADDDALTGLYFRHHWRRPRAHEFGQRMDADADPLFSRVRRQLIEYLNGDRTRFDLPTAARGDDLQHRVWALLTHIPYGGTTSYGDLAATLGEGTTAWQVGQAVGRNPLSIVVPCHRVVGRDGRLTGYAGGLKRKQCLLELEEPERARAARLF